MKRSAYILVILAIALLTMPQSCTKDPNGEINIEGIETGVYNKIKAFRESNGVSGTFVHSILLAQESEAISKEMKNSGAVLDSARLNSYIETLHSKFTMSNEVILMQVTPDDTYETIAANWTSDASLKDVLLEEYTQCIVSIEIDQDDIAYVAMILCIIHQ